VQQVHICIVLRVFLVDNFAFLVCQDHSFVYNVAQD